MKIFLSRLTIARCPINIIKYFLAIYHKQVCLRNCTNCAPKHTLHHGGSYYQNILYYIIYTFQAQGCKIIRTHLSGTTSGSVSARGKPTTPMNSQNADATPFTKRLRNISDDGLLFRERRRVLSSAI